MADAQERGPWDNYQASPTEHGPWDKYATPQAVTEPPPEPEKQGFFGALKEDVSALVPHSLKDYGLQVANTVIPGSVSTYNLLNSYRQGDQQRKEAGHGLAYRALAPLGAAATGVNLSGMERDADQGDTAGVLGHTILPVAMALPIAAHGTPEATMPLARGGGAALEKAGMLARTPIGDMRYKGMAATPANLAGAAIGGIGGGALGHMLGVPEAPYVGATVGGIGGAAAGDALAKGVENLGSRLRQFGGYEPPPEPRDLSGIKPLPRIPKSRMIPDFRDVPLKSSALPPLGKTISDLRDAAPNSSPLPPMGRMIPDFRDVPIPESKRIPPPPVRWNRMPEPTPEGGQIVIPGQSPMGRTVILPGEEIDPLKTRSAGSAAQATAKDLQRLAAQGDRSAAIELTRRRIPVEGAPKEYSAFPLPKGKL